jgi:hypothetical protein
VSTEYEDALRWAAKSTVTGRLSNHQLGVIDVARDIYADGAPIADVRQLLRDAGIDDTEYLIDTFGVDNWWSRPSPFKAAK